MLGKVIYDITPFTLLDYPHKSACILWYTGCNMRCLYCYNPEIVLGKGNKTFEEVIAFLKTRVGLLDAVVFSGGECLMHKKIVEQIRIIKSMGFLVKVDTNGSKPEVLEKLIQENLVDYVALDFKATKEKFNHITRSDLYVYFEKSLSLLLNSNVTFEVRTTVHTDLLQAEDLNAMTAILKEKGYSENYYLQQFRNSKETLGNLPDSDTLSMNELISSEGISLVLR